MNLPNLVLIASGTLTGMLAGILFAFSVSVIPGLRDLDAKHHLLAMQRINIRIINPMFMLCFLGPTALLPLSVFLHQGGAAILLMIAAALYIIGVNGVTIVGNVPLNNRLANVSVETLTPTEAGRTRTDYHGVGSAWMRLHHLRTLAAVGSTALVLFACLVQSVSQ